MLNKMKKTLIAATLAITALAGVAMAAYTAPVDGTPDCIFVLKQCWSWDAETGKEFKGYTTCYECDGVIQSCNPCGSFGRGK